MTVAGWAGLAGEDDYRIRLVYHLCGLPALQHLPAIHRPWGNREDSMGCFAFSPLCRGVSHQLALDRPSRKIERPEKRKGKAAARIVNFSHDGMEDCSIITSLDIILCYNSRDTEPA